jgi:hypothetical protein
MAGNRYPAPNEMSLAELEALKQELELAKLRSRSFMYLDVDKVSWLLEQVMRPPKRPVGGCTGTLVHSEYDSCPVHDR